MNEIPSDEGAVIPAVDQAERILTRDLYASLTKFLMMQTEENWDFWVDYDKPGAGRFACVRHDVEIGYAEWTKLADGNILTGVPQLIKAIEEKHMEIYMQGRIVV